MVHPLNAYTGIIPKTAFVRIMLATCIFLIHFTSPVDAQRQGPVLWNTGMTSDTNYQARIVREADQAVKTIARQPYTVVHKKSFSGDVHNYESLAYYAWPNPQDPDGAYIVRDGYPSPEYKKYDAMKMFEMCDNMRYLGQAYQISHDSQYTKAAIRQLRVWFLDDSTKMNPNLRYGQIVPGYDNGKGHPGVLAEAYSLLDVLDCIALLQQNRLLGKKELQGLRAWFSKLNTWLCGSQSGLIMNNTKNNLSIMYDVLRYRIAMFTGNQKIKAEIRNAFAPKRLNPQFQADGRQPEELKRSKSMMYSIFNLSHLLEFCQMLRYDRRDYSQYKPRASAAVGFIKKYINNKEDYPYTEIGNWNTYQSQFTEVENCFTSLFK